MSFSITCRVDLHRAQCGEFKRKFIKFQQIFRIAHNSSPAVTCRHNRVTALYPPWMVDTEFDKFGSQVQSEKIGCWNTTRWIFSKIRKSPGLRNNQIQRMAQILIKKTGVHSKQLGFHIEGTYQIWYQGLNLCHNRKPPTRKYSALGTSYILLVG